MLLALAPLTPVAGQSPADNHQAHGISAIFDTVTETTTVTWANQVSTDITVLSNMFTSTYNVYRHTAPINTSNLAGLTPFATVDVCSSAAAGGNPGYCSGTDHPGHAVAYPVAPGTDGLFYYAITTTLSNGSEMADLLPDESNLTTPVSETAQPVQTPFIISAIFDATASETTLTWLNYNDILPVHPTTGPDAMQIRIWQTPYSVDRTNGLYLPVTLSPIAVVDPTNTSYVVTVPPDTQRSSYYSITYFLPNHTYNGTSGLYEDYEDLRFVGKNTLTSPVTEDNRPPPQPVLLGAEFVPEPQTGGGHTNLSWADVASETGETYSVYRSDQPFTTVLRNDVELLVSGILEGINSFKVQVPRGFLGYSYYCVVTVDSTGVINTQTTGDSCTTNAIEEDAFYNWVAEPTNVHAEFIGDRTTRVTWDDQLGIEGEVYHIWYSTYRVNTGQFVENETLVYLGTVSDGIGTFDAPVPEGEYRTNSFYWVTSEALYGNINGTYHYTDLIQNFFQVPFEDTLASNPPRIKNAYSIGSMNLVSLEWFNEDEANESYAIWRHYGAPFGEDENDLSDTDADGWELVLDDIATGLETGETITREFDIPPNVDREVWYAVTITDEWGNFNGEIFGGIGGNAFKVPEDTLLPNATLTVVDGEGAPYESTTMVAGQYSFRLQVNEDLGTTPTINITTLDGAVLTNDDEPLSVLNDNRNNPEVGPLFTYDFSILSNTEAGDMVIRVTMEDESSNEVVQTWTHLSIDAQLPQVSIYSPTPASDGSKYLYGNRINILAGAEDDVIITTFQYRFTYHFGGETGSPVSTPWSDLTGVTDLDGNSRALSADMEISSGNFETGKHALTVRATDGAGNEVQKRVEFVVDFCRNNLDGTTYCNYVEDLKPPVEPETITPSYTDPPYVVVWIIAVVNLLAIVVSLMIIKVGMSGPKKKKRGDDDEEDESWMAEFIGTSQDLDMDAVTGTGTSSEPEEEKKEEEAKSAPEEDDDDPFAINIVQRKERRRKKKPEPEPEEDDDDDDDDADDDDDDDDDVDDDDDDDDEDDAPRKKPVRRAVGRRPAPRKAPVKRRAVKRKSDDD